MIRNRRTGRGGPDDAARQAGQSGGNTFALARQLRGLYHAVPPSRRLQLIAFGFLMLLGAIVEVAAIAGVIPFLSLLAGEESERIIEVLQGLGAQSREDQVLLAATLFIALALLAGATRLLLVATSQRWAFGTGHEMAVDIERRLLSQPYAFHVERNSSTLLAALEKVHVLSLNVLLQLTYAATAAVAAVLIVGALVLVDPLSASVAALGFGCVYLVVSGITSGRLHRNSEEGSRAYHERLKIAQESFGGIRDIIIDDSRQMHVDAFADADSRYIKATGSTTFIGAAPRFVIEAAASIVVAVLALLLWQRSGSFTAALPVLGVMALGGFRLLPYLQQLYFSWTVLAGYEATISDVVGMLSLPVAGEGPRPLPLTLHQGITFDGVTFRYSAASRPAIDDVSIVIQRGARVALVGRNGSGKSTLADLAMGLLYPTSGRILIDGTALNTGNMRAWRQSIAHVPQAIFLADTTIAQNIAFGVGDKEIDGARVETAAKAAQLDDLLDDLPNGLDTRIGERGIRLSGGQRQRLGIARAFYKDTPVLVLDEATSALDVDAEAKLMRYLFEFGEQRTIILISHRASVTDLCDMVFTLNRGRIVGLDDRRKDVRKCAKA